jgi:hypothetical protein
VDDLLFFLIENPVLVFSLDNGAFFDDDLLGLFDLVVAAAPFFFLFDLISAFSVC